MVSPEQLIERAKDAPERPREERPPRRDGDRDEAVAAGTAAARRD